MNVTLTDLDKMPGTLRHHLHQHRIKNTSRLLNRAAWPTDRHTLLNKTGLEEEELRPWIVAADLCRVKRISPEIAQQLALSGAVDSAHALGQSEAEQLTDDGMPDKHELSHLIGAAHKIAPRVIWDANNTYDFDNIQRANVTRSNRLLNTSLLATWGVAIAMYVVNILWNLAKTEIMERWHIQQIYAPQLWRLAMQAAHGLDRAWVTSFAALFGAVLVILTLSWLALTGVRWVINSVITLRLMRSHATRQVLLMADSRDDRWMWQAAAWIGAGIAISVAVAFGIMQFTDTTIPNRVLAIGGAVWVMVTAVVVFAGDVITLERQLHSDEIIQQRALMRFMLLRLIITLIYLALIVAFLNVVLLAVAAHSRFAEQVVEPRYRARTAETYSQLESIWNGDDDALSYQAGMLLDRLDAIEAKSDVHGVLVPYDEEYADELRLMIITLIAPGVIVMIVGYFIVPYLLMRHFKEALTFILLALVASAIEAILSNLATSVTGVPPGSLVAVVLIGGVIVFNSAAFETVESLGKGETESRTCVKCGELLPPQARFCMTCGAEQPPHPDT